MLLLLNFALVQTLINVYFVVVNLNLDYVMLASLCGENKTKVGFEFKVTFEAKIAVGFWISTLKHELSFAYTLVLKNWL